MLLPEFVKDIPGIANWQHSEKIIFFGWCLHSHSSHERFSQADMRVCYAQMHLLPPSGFSAYFGNLERAKKLLKDKQGYRLSKPMRDELMAKHGQRESTVEVDKLLADLPSRVADLNERVFLDEALACFRCGAFRAAIVMTWNLSFDHLCEWILKNHLPAFDTQLVRTCPSAKVKSIKSKDDFAEIKESEVLQVCKSAGILTINLHKILVEKLGRRNTAAHPSSVTINRLQAEDFISDLVNNVVLKLT